jgi:DNA polymerase V
VFIALLSAPFLKEAHNVKERYYIAIDLKSFYASVECVERGLDPFKTNLVVADPTRSKSTICLAITPAMKKLGVKNRCRIHEIPPNIEYITAKPRMQLYIDYSSNIYEIYLKYVSPDDIHVYSIDECFIDITTYMSLYHKNPKELAVTLMEAVFNETGICATAGIGTNLYLAKIAMDIIAKHVDDHIGILNEDLFKVQLWEHKPLTDFWRIGQGTANKLGRNGIYTMGDLARASLYNEDWLYKLFGIDAEILIDHAWGIEPCTIKDIKAYEPETNSLSSGQVLMRNYSFDEAKIVVNEMTDLLVLDLVEKKLVTDSVTLYISYDHRFELPGSNGTAKLGYPTNSSKKIMSAVAKLYDKITDRYTGIRRINITCNRVTKDTYYQLDLFTDPLEIEKEKHIQQAMLEIRKRYGKNAVMRGVNLLECSNFIERNNQIGGHHA